MEIRNLFDKGGSLADLRYNEKKRKMILRNSRGNNARGVYIRLVTI